MIVNNLIQDIMEADMVLIGIGNELQDMPEFKNKNNKISQVDIIKNNGLTEIMNEKNEKNNELLYYKYLIDDKNNKEIILTAYNKLFDLIVGKDYFIVNLTTDGWIKHSKLDQNKIVSPCGDYDFLQCENNCKNILYHTNYFINPILDPSKKIVNLNMKELICEECQSALIFNHFQKQKYAENRYLDQWNIYQTWLQRSLNKRILILELGVDLDLPQIIRWPFEKISFYNNKAKIYRIHETLPQLSKELIEKGISIKINALSFLTNEIE